MTGKSTRAQKIIITLLIANLLSASAGIAQNHFEAKSVQQMSQENAQQLEELQRQLAEDEDHIRTTDEELQQMQKSLEDTRREVSRGNSRAMNVEVTAYDLSEASCNKGTSHPAYGLTATGKNLAGNTLESARAIAVDPRVIPLGSKVRIKFKDKEMQQYNGVYTACDTGGAINGNRIDLFAGDGAHSLCMEIGRREAVAVVLC